MKVQKTIVSSSIILAFCVGGCGTEYITSNTDNTTAPIKVAVVSGKTMTKQQKEVFNYEMGVLSDDCFHMSLLEGQAMQQLKNGDNLGAETTITQLTNSYNDYMPEIISLQKQNVDPTVITPWVNKVQNALNMISSANKSINKDFSEGDKISLFVDQLTMDKAFQKCNAYVMPLMNLQK